MSRFRFLPHACLAILFSVGIAGLGSVFAQGPQSNLKAKTPTKTSKSEVDEKPRRKTAADITPAREAAAHTFVKQHHPELSDLLTLLQEQNPKEYDRAIRELFRESERLANLRERDEERYELELRVWKINSRVRLAAARITMGETPELRRDLRDLLLEQIDARRAALVNERDKTAERLEKLDKQIQQMDRQRELMAERALRALTGGSEKVSTP